MADQNNQSQAAPGIASMQSPFNSEPGNLSPSSAASSPTDHRRMSAEWDASKVPPSRFQRRKGSIYSTPASRDGHIDKNYAEKYHEKLAEKGWGKK
ncbi:hypothetical protein VSDG_00295 [Cytospora chrysosperma]|uniref:Uncharacterized protein n=1 Tax=Cytospora chrysosperma TaxID=252740 RepID=A0A423WP27_CYTCH|nr:hypothetical protein VSDG_00295 [Valsa sordida]